MASKESATIAAELVIPPPNARANAKETEQGTQDSGGNEKLAKEEKARMG